MGHRSRRSETAAEPRAAARLDTAGFAARLDASTRTLWCIAAAVLQDRSLIEDVLQEAALVGLRKLHQFDPATNFNAWMGQIVRFVALNHGRRRAGSPVRSVDPQTIEASAAPSAQRAPVSSNGRLIPETEPFDDDVRRALMSLDESARACLLLRTLLDMPYREISLALDLPEGTAMSHVHRARRTMRGLIEAPHATTSTGADG